MSRTARPAESRWHYCARWGRTPTSIGPTLDDCMCSRATTIPTSERRSRTHTDRGLQGWVLQHQPLNLGRNVGAGVQVHQHFIGRLGHLNQAAV